MKKLLSGKVREVYQIDEKTLAIVTTDRISAFDVIMNEPVPNKGVILNSLTRFWLEEVLSDMPNHYVSSELPSGFTQHDFVNADYAKGRTMVVRAADMVPLEFIVRERLAGSGWKEYRSKGTLHGRKMPSDLQLGSKLPEPMLTPSSKGDLGEHDVNYTMDQAADVIGTKLLRQCEELALTAFERGSKIASHAGFVLADTKYELGLIDGTLSICDEVMTPDSSRYWLESELVEGDVPPAYDKQLLRDWLETQDWNKTPPPPALPPLLLNELSERYVDIYERLTDRRLA